MSPIAPLEMLIEAHDEASPIIARTAWSAKAMLLARVLATSCNRCANFQPGRGCIVGYTACKAGLPLGTARLFVRRRAA